VSLSRLREQLAQARVRVLELKRDAEAGERINRELAAENASLARDLREWQRIAQVRAERIVALEQGR
jgi:hypothetical protein